MMSEEAEFVIEKKYFNNVYLEKLTDNTRLQILYGGSSSGKSVFLAQRVVTDVLQGGRNYLCVRNVKATIRHSMFNEIMKAIAQFNALSEFKVNRSDLVITCTNGFQILFAGLDDVEKIKSITPAIGVITDVWIEEATETMEGDIKQLQRRLRGHSKYAKRTILSFNPILQSHWIYETYFDNWEDNKTTFDDGNVSILKTTYKDNLRFLDKGDIELLEDETDKYYHDVYTLGNWGVLGNVIYKPYDINRDNGWEVIDLRKETALIGAIEVPLIKTFDNYKNGLDFGFSQDPNAFVRTHYDKNKNTIYVMSEMYAKEMTNDTLAAELDKRIPGEYVVCDSSEPKSIKELRQMQIRALGAKKGKDSVNFGIDWLQRQHIIIDVRCQNTKNEIQGYKWREDKDGIVIAEPVKKNDHLMDALRYAYETEMISREIRAVRSLY